MPEKQQVPFQLLAGDPALDFVNTLDNRFVASGAIELMPDYAALLRFMQQAGLLDQAQVRQLARRGGSVAQSLIKPVHELREALATVFYSSNQPERTAALNIVQRFATQAAGHRRLTMDKAAVRDAVASWAWAAKTGESSLPLWVLADAAQTLLTSKDSQRVRACCRESCQWLFLDSSKNHSRRWCDMKICGNRVKAKRYKAAHAG